jgi:amino-acid N-acetyltransferase
MKTIRIERGTAPDMPHVQRLLERNLLPIAGLEAHVETLLVARSGDAIVGSAALEMYASGALLRSVCVDPLFQGQALGQRLTEAAIDIARDAGRPAIYLLTTTAERFFPRFGFECVARDQVPADVQQSVEFTSACPASAIVMSKVLTRG